MNHDQYKEQLQLLMYDELTAEERTALDQHLRQCPECRQELEELKRFHATLLHAGAVAPVDELLNEARQELRTALRTERSTPPLWNRISDFITSLLPNYKIALGGIATLAVGILLGRIVLAPIQQPAAIEPPAVAKVTTSVDGETHITNLRFVDSDASDGEVEFTFDAISPVHIKGSINDDRVQKVLAHALVNDQNPGVRLRSVSAFATQMQTLKSPDKEVKAALILALKTDTNPGVRKEALKTLQGFPFDEEIKQAFLHVLMRDGNPALRIAAINSLDSARVQGQPRDKDLLEVLKQRMHSDNNNYVRIRAKAVLEEAKQQ
jgi:anti-sigma factor RsiW